MARAALGVGVPLALGLTTGGTVPGVLVALGGVAGALSDRPGPYPLRVRGITLAGVGAALGLALGIAVHGRGWPAVAVLVLVAGVAALLSSLGAGWPVTALCLLVYAALGTGPLGVLEPRWLPVPLLLIGVCWALLLLLPERVLESRTVRLPEWALRSRNIWLPEWGLRSKTLRWPEPVLRSSGVRLPRSFAPFGTLRVPGWVVRSRIVPWPELGVQSRTLRLPRWVVRSGFVEQAPSRAGGPARSARARGAPGVLRPQVSALVREARLTFNALSCLRLMLCVALAAALTEMRPLDRSYWVVLTVALVFGPGLGSTFGRALRNSGGALIGAGLGALIVTAGPPDSVFLAAAVILAALLAFGISRNHWLLVLFLTPLIILLVDVLTPAGRAVAEARLVDVLLGCAIALGIGYAPWPRTWHANLPRSFARAVDAAADYLVSTLPTFSEASTATAQARAHKQLAALRTEIRRALDEPEAERGRALAWRPAADALEGLLDAVTSIRTSGEGPPSTAEVAVVNVELRHLAAAACSGRSAPQDLSLTTMPALEHVTESVRSLQRALEDGVLR